MVKVYRLKYNLPTFSAGDICILDDKGNLWWKGNPDPKIDERERELHWRSRVCMYKKKTLEKFNILATYFEEVHDSAFYAFWPYENCKYYYVSDSGVDWDIWEEEDKDYQRKSLENCFLNKEDAEKLWGKIINLVRLAKCGTVVDNVLATENGRFQISGKFNSEFIEMEKSALRQLVELGNDK